jgi:hemolysin D
MPPDALRRLNPFNWTAVIAPRRSEREFLPAALEIIETPASPAGRLSLAIIVCAALAALIWACLGHIDIIATATGRIVPVGKSKVIQPPDVGVVAAIHVADGDFVRAGQVLVELDPRQAGADRDRYARDLKDAELDLARYQALWSALKTGQPPSLADLPADATPAERDRADSAMHAQYDEQVAALAGLDQQIAEKAAEAAAAANSIARFEDSLPYVREQADLRQQLMTMQYGNKLAYLQAQQTLVEQQRQILVLKDQRDQIVADRRALVHKREEAAGNYQKTLLDDLGKARDKVSELRADASKAHDTWSFKTLRAPIDGTVQELSIHTVGGVVTPAQPLMTIVPVAGGLVVEAMVDNSDVGFVRPGQDAQVKISTFNFTQYGLIDGKVESVSRDTVEQRGTDRPGAPAAPSEPAREPVYVAHIRLGRDWMATESGRERLGAGMAVTVEIHTGRRRIIDYLLSPLKRKVEESLHER